MCSYYIMSIKRIVDIKIGEKPYNGTFENVIANLVDCDTLKIDNGSSVILTAQPMLSNATIQFPSVSGTIALVGDIPSNIVTAPSTITTNNIVFGNANDRTIKDSTYSLNQNLNMTDDVVFNSVDSTTNYKINTNVILQTNGLDNMYFGVSSGLGSQASTFQNIGVGHYTLQSLTNASGQNTALGFYSMNQATTALHNTCVGQLSGGFLINGDENVLLGSQAGTNYASNESNNICLSSLGLPGDNNKIRIGNIIHTDCDISGDLHQAGEIDAINQITVKEPTNNNLQTVMTYEVSTQHGVIFAVEQGVDFKPMQIGLSGSTVKCYFVGDIDINTGGVLRINGTNKLSETHLNTVNQFPSVSGQLAVSGIGNCFMSFYNTTLNSTSTTMTASPTSLSLSVIADAGVGSSNWTPINDGTNIVWFRCDNTIANYYTITFNCAISIIGGAQTGYMYIEVNGVKRGQIYINLLTTLSYVTVSAIAQISNTQLVKIFVGNLTNATQVSIYGANFNASLMAEFNR